MKTAFAFLISCLFGLLILPSDLSAQEMEPKRMENTDWKNIVYVDFHPGKRGRALEIIDNHYMKAAEKAGTSTPQMRVEFATGEWDMMIVWHMKEGVESMTWELSPDNIAWRKALNEQEGGKEKADELMAEYQSLIAHSKNEIGMVKK